MLVHIEGNVGCGKSTLLHHLEQGLTGCTTVPEPVAGWAAHLRGVYGTQCALWALPMQALSACTRAEALYIALASAAPDTFVVVERSAASGDIFSKLTLSDEERGAYNVLGERYKMIWRSMGHVRETTIYLRASPTTCARRVQTRSRIGEEGIHLRFLERLHKAHDSAFLHTADLVVDCEEDSSDEVARRVMAFLTAA